MLVFNKFDKIKNSFFRMTFAKSTDPDTQPYKYNGKELDRKLGLNLYDYFARQMDNAVPRFTSVDPMAEKYYSISPYVYVANNSLKYIDPTSRKIKVATSFFGNATNEAESIARVAATTLGSGLVNSLIINNKAHTVTAHWFNQNNLGDKD